MIYIYPPDSQQNVGDVILMATVKQLLGFGDTKIYPVKVFQNVFFSFYQNNDSCMEFERLRGCLARERLFFVFYFYLFS